MTRISSKFSALIPSCHNNTARTKSFITLHEMEQKSPRNLRQVLNNLFCTILILSASSAFAQNLIKDKQPSSTLNSGDLANIQSTPNKTDSAAVQTPIEKTSPSTKNNNQNSEKADLLNSLDKTALIQNIQGGMANLLLGNKSVSLMFDDKENDNIERAIDSYKSNQSFAPDSDEDSDNNDKKKTEDDESALEIAKKEQDDFNSKSYIYLASIMYSTPQDWVVWINDKKITTSTNDKTKELYLQAVQKDHVSILWNVSPSKLKVLLGRKAEDAKLKPNENGQIEVKFDLHPNQTFVLGSNSVVEGKTVMNMLKKKENEEKSKWDELKKSVLSSTSKR